jgi:hypothetical protein
MYSKQEAAALKQQFWTTFGRYMAPVLSAEGEIVNWINFKTGEKDIYIRMRADNKKAAISIELTHKDPGVQQLYFEQFVQLKNLFTEIVGSAWEWQLHTADENGRIISGITKDVAGYSIFKKEDWPALISFFKTEIIRLDEFWSQTKYSFESLR